jgi:predicted aminopeptidase
MKWFFLPLALFLNGCQIGYLFQNGYQQMRLLNQRVPIDEVLKDPAVPEETKRKLRLSQEASDFAEKTLKLKKTENYTSYVELGRPYVTYSVSAAPKWKLEHFRWYFPVVGSVPYKGFFDVKKAEEEVESLKKQDLDTYMRGVSAYSTLGWFKDPILSSMMHYKDHDLVNTIIHETVHATLYIKSSADFNERMAVFLGNKGSEFFYLQKEGPDSKTFKEIQKDNEDDKVFSQFIGKELTELEEWYKSLPENQKNEELRQKRFKEIQEHFKKDIAPHLKSDQYKNFPELTLNNARLMVYKTYMQDLSDFESLYRSVKGDFTEFLNCCKKLKERDDPAEGLKQITSELNNSQASTCEKVKF